jgi:hypothetical protein
MWELSVTNYLIGLILPGPSLFPQTLEGPDTGLGTTRSFASRKVSIYFSSRTFLKQRPFTYNFQRAPLFETESRIKMTPDTLSNAVLLPCAAVW